MLRFLPVFELCHFLLQTQKMLVRLFVLFAQSFDRVLDGETRVAKLGYFCLLDLCV